MCVTIKLQQKNQREKKKQRKFKHKYLYILQHALRYKDITKQGLNGEIIIFIKQ